MTTPSAEREAATPRDRLPFVLRRERFGGLLFEPANGTYVEVDHEAYRFLREWVETGRGPRTDDERDLLVALGRVAPSLRRGEGACHLPEVPPQELPPRRHATVLDAPTVVDLQLTRRCRMGCPHCYMSSTPTGADMPFDDARRVLEQAAAAGVCQIAIGGGEPLLHPRFADLLYLSSRLGVMPNLTTTGDGLTERSLRAMADCCGAVALSLEGVREEYDRRRRRGFAFFREVHDAFRTAGIPTVFQVTLSEENLPQLPDIVDYCLEQEDLYGVLFLAYKASGRGEGFHRPLSAVKPATLFPALRDAFLRLSEVTRVGYDCCLTPGIVGMDEAFGYRDPDVVEGCSAMRTSMGVTVELDVVPCTFLHHDVLGSLKDEALLDVWHGEEAEAFRRRLDDQVDRDARCRACSSRRACLGGCPEWDLVRCNARG